MAERVVHILEMIEIDVEHRGLRGAISHALNDRLEAFAKIVSVRQAAEWIVQGEMAQPALASRDRRGGATHVGEHECSQERKAGESHPDKYNPVSPHLRARALV